MDWGKAKAWLVIAFLLLDIFLTQKLHTVSSAAHGTVFGSIQNVLRQEHIALSTSLPHRPKKAMSMLVLAPALPTSLIRLAPQVLSKPVRKAPGVWVSPTGQLHLETSGYLTGVFPHFQTALHLVHVLGVEAKSQAKIPSIREETRGFPLFGDYIALKKKGRLYSLSLRWDWVLSHKTASGQLISAKTAILDALPNYRGHVSHDAIVRVALGYKALILPGTQNQVGMPTWQVRFADGDVLYVNAYTGRLEV